MSNHKRIFYNLLERKTGWGRNEIKKLYEEAELYEKTEEEERNRHSMYNNPLYSTAKASLENRVKELERKIDILFESEREQSSNEIDDPPW